MSKITEYDTRDALLLLSSHKAGKCEVDKFLSISKGRASGRIYARIMKRIRHPENYVGRGLSSRARMTGILLVLVLALCFALLGVASASLTHKLIYERESVTGFAQKTTTELPRGITEFAKPHIEEATEKVIIKSSSVYNIEYSTQDSVFYYLQKPLARAYSDDEMRKHNENAAQNADLCVVLGEYTGFVTVSRAKDLADVSLSFTDGRHSYTVFGAESIEQAVKIARSVRAE